MRSRFTKEIPLISGISAFASILSYIVPFGNLLSTEFVKDHPILSQIIAILILFCLWIVGLIVFSVLSGRKHPEPKPFLSSILIDGKWPIRMWDIKLGERDTAFQQLRGKAKHEIYVMGIGMTNFSEEKAFLDEIVRRNINIRINMLNYESIIMPDEKDFSMDNLVSGGFYMPADMFDWYLDRTDHKLAMINTYTKLKKRQSNVDSDGLISVKRYSFFIPINCTIVDPKQDGELLLEFILPLTRNRLAIHATKRNFPESFDYIVKSFDAIWDISKP